MQRQDRDVEPATAPEPVQPDPMLNEGRAGTGRKWAVTAIIVVVLLAVMYGVTAHRAEVKDEQRHSELETPQPNATAPGQALPGGRTTADAPATAVPKTRTRGPSQ